MQHIAIVSSTTFGGRNKACLESGLAFSLGGKTENAILAPLQSFGICDQSKLRESIRNAVNSDPRPDLIVAIDGLEMAQAAASELQEQDPKFIFLSNDALEGNTIALAGGVNMNATGVDDIRKDALRKAHPDIQDEGMYLVVNNNSPIWLKDARNWPPSRVARFFHGVANPENKRTTDADNHFIVEFEKLAKRKPAPTGLVISADPYFRHWRTALTMAIAEKLPIPVCYPFQEFVDASAGNKGNNVALDSPRLSNSNRDDDETTAYFQLGKQVGKFVSGMRDVGVVTWNGSEWLETSPKMCPPRDEAPLIEIEIRVKGRVDETTLQKVLAASRGMR
jgi:hypothetical protein